MSPKWPSPGKNIHRKLPQQVVARQSAASVLSEPKVELRNIPSCLCVWGRKATACLSLGLNPSDINHKPVVCHNCTSFWENLHVLHVLRVLHNPRPSRPSSCPPCPPRPPCPRCPPRSPYLPCPPLRALPRPHMCPNRPPNQPHRDSDTVANTFCHRSQPRASSGVWHGQDRVRPDHPQAPVRLRRRRPDPEQDRPLLLPQWRPL